MVFIKEKQAAFVDKREGLTPVEGVSLNLLRRSISGRLFQRHDGDTSRDIFAFSSPRSGSTMLMALIEEQPNIKVFDEPLNIHDPVVWKETGCRTWAEMTALTDRERVFSQYFKSLSSGKISSKNPPFYSENVKSGTNRCYYKILHGGEDMVQWFSENFNGYVLILMRHPIAVTLSHWILPRLPHYFKNDAFKQMFSAAQVAFTEKAIIDGDPFTMGIVNWCIQNKVRSSQPLQDKWARVSYEELLCFPELVNKHLADRLDISMAHISKGALQKPSKTMRPIQSDTRKLIEADDMASKLELISHWQTKVTPSQEALTFDILERFEIDFYQRGASLPAQKYRIG